MKAKGAVSDTGGALVTTHEDAEALERTASISSGRSWTDSYAKVQGENVILCVLFS